MRSELRQSASQAANSVVVGRTAEVLCAIAHHEAEAHSLLRDKLNGLDVDSHRR
jgi:hypothetical protein